jgi:hypothetical protein
MYQASATERLGIGLNAGIWSEASCIEESARTITKAQAADVQENFQNLRLHFLMLFEQQGDATASTPEAAARRIRSEEFQLQSWRRLRQHSGAIATYPSQAQCSFDAAEGGWIAKLAYRIGTDGNPVHASDTMEAARRLEVSAVNGRIRFANFRP